MAQCHVCGNKITQITTILLDGKQYEFDCLECAKQALSPSCIHCGCSINQQINPIKNYTYYCCEACAEGCEIVTHPI